MPFRGRAATEGISRIAPLAVRTFLAATLLLFFIMDPFGNMVAINCILADYSPARRRWIILRESLIAFAILALFLFVGGQILAVLGIHTSTMSISGGIILLSSPTMFRLLGRRGSIAIERLMGILLVMLSIQMLLDGIHLYLDQF